VKGPRVLRGGSFGVDERLVRCAYRDQLFPERKLMYRGFRVVVSPLL